MTISKNSQWRSLWIVKNNLVEVLVALILNHKWFELIAKKTLEIYIYKRIEVSVNFSSLVILLGSHFEHGMEFPNN